VTPAPARIAWRAFQRFLDHSGPDRAAAVAYYTLLSLLPLFIFVISVGVAFLGSFDAAYRGTLILFGGLVVHLDQASLDTLRAFVERSVRFQWPGILILAWTSKRVFGGLLSALETVFQVPGRGFARGNLMALAMVLITGVGLLATLALTLVVATAEGLLLRFAPMGSGALRGATALALTRGLPVFITLSFFFIVYRVVPHRVMRARHALAGAALATVLWEGAKAGFAYYVRNLAHYAGLYGTLEGVIVLALWLELSVSIILYCGEVVALLVPAAAPSATSVPPAAANTIDTRPAGE
jgi:membrane protein